MKMPNMLRLAVIAVVVIMFLAIPCYADHSWGGEQGLVDTTVAVTDHGWGGEDDPLGVDDSGFDSPVTDTPWADDTGWDDSEWQLVLSVWNMIG